MIPIVKLIANMSLVMRKPVFGFSTRPNTNHAVQPQKVARGLKISDLRSRGIVDLLSM